MIRHSLLCFLWVAASIAAAANPLAEQIVIVANKNLPESLELAKYYAAKRGIATNRICLLDIPTGEEMGRVFYEDRLRDPFLEFLRAQKFIMQVKRETSPVAAHESKWKTIGSSVKYVALMYGVPLKIADTRGSIGQKAAQLMHAGMARNDAAVDSELALALLDKFDITGRVPNFLHDQIRWDDLGSSTNELLLVTRLDGPDAQTAKRMLDDALYAEQHGLWGRAYFDTRGLTGSSYLMGDIMLREAAYRFDREGWWVGLDTADAVLPVFYPMENCAVYMGWYSENLAGPFTRTNFAFARGAIAYHNHSANAKTLRSRTDGWCGPLLAKGACCTIGAVGEPYLSLTPDTRILADRLLAGLTFAEAAYMALPALSWQATVVGDPLYRPFARPLEEIGLELEKSGDPDVAWAVIAKVNRLVQRGRFNDGMDLLRTQVKKTGSLVLREQLADLYLLNQLLAEADAEYRVIITEAATAATAYRAAEKETALFRSLKRYADADKIAAEVRTKWPGTPYEMLLAPK